MLQLRTVLVQMDVVVTDLAVLVMYALATKLGVAVIAPKDNVQKVFHGQR
jgi:hypothetical protein